MSHSPLRHIVAHLNDAKVSREVLMMAVGLARQHGASLTAVLGVEQVAPAAFMNATTAAMARQLMDEHLTTLRTQVGTMVTEVATHTGFDIQLITAQADAVLVLKGEARTADLLVVGQEDPEGAGGLDQSSAASIIMGAGSPVICVPHIGWPQAPEAGVAQRVLVAWRPTSESARALRDALPIMARASHVQVVSFVDADEMADADVQRRLDPVRAHLARHGIEAEYVVSPSREPSLGERLRRGWIPDVSVAETLLSHAADVSADLIVMGGYGHSRAWQAVLGGVTRTMLETMTVPILFSH